VSGIADAELFQGAPAAAASAGTGEAEVTLMPAQARWVTLAVRVPPQSAKALGPGVHPIRFQVVAADGAPAGAAEKSTFVIPR
jgi:hypothetical protein